MCALANWNGLSMSRSPKKVDGQAPTESQAKKRSLAFQSGGMGLLMSANYMNTFKYSPTSVRLSQGPPVS